MKLKELPLLAFMGPFVLIGFIAFVAWVGLCAGRLHAEQMLDRIFDT